MLGEEPRAPHMLGQGSSTVLRCSITVAAAHSGLDTCLGHRRSMGLQKSALTSTEGVSCFGGYLGKVSKGLLMLCVKCYTSENKSRLG
jgi:hypothetical protein